MGVCTHSSTNVQVARAQTRYHATLHTRATARGSQDATPAPLLGAYRARQRWCGERYRQTPGDHATNLGATMLVLLNGSAGLLLRKTRHAVTQRASASLCTKCTRFDIIAVLYTCTTVASRVATNACATHLRFLTKSRTPPCLASSSPWVSGDSPQEEVLE